MSVILVCVVQRPAARAVHHHVEVLEEVRAVPVPGASKIRVKLNEDARKLIRAVQKSSLYVRLYNENTYRSPKNTVHDVIHCDGTYYSSVINWTSIYNRELQFLALKQRLCSSVQ